MTRFATVAKRERCVYHRGNLSVVWEKRQGGRGEKSNCCKYAYHYIETPLRTISGSVRRVSCFPPRHLVILVSGFISINPYIGDGVGVL